MQMMQLQDRCKTAARPFEVRWNPALVLAKFSGSEPGATLLNPQQRLFRSAQASSLQPPGPDGLDSLVFPGT